MKNGAVVLVALILANHAFGSMRLRGKTEAAAEAERSIVGKLDHCTGTVVSLPGKKPTMILTAAHCGSSVHFSLSDGQKIPVDCVGSKTWSETRSPSDDVMLCASPEAIDTGGLGGCVDLENIVPHDKLYAIGHGNETWGAPMRRTAVQGRMEVIDPGKLGEDERSLLPKDAIHARGEVALTKGDSGGPASRGWRGRFLRVNGVNSTHSGPVRDTLENTMGTFAPVRAQKNQAYFRRAIAYFQDKLKMSPTVCGITDTPDDLDLTRVPRRLLREETPAHVDD